MFHKSNASSFYGAIADQVIGTKSKHSSSNLDRHKVTSNGMQASSGHYPKKRTYQDMRRSEYVPSKSEHANQLVARYYPEVDRASSSRHRSDTSKGRSIEGKRRLRRNTQ